MRIRRPLRQALRFQLPKASTLRSRALPRDGTDGPTMTTLADLGAVTQADDERLFGDVAGLIEEPAVGPPPRSTVSS